MKKVDLFRTVLLSIILVFFLSFFARAADPIKIGIIGPMQFTQGEGMWNGATMAAEEINKAGGVTIKGAKRLIEIIKVDSNEFLSVPEATNAMELAVSRYKVDFLAGGFRTEAMLAMQDIAMDNKKIFFGCGCAFPGVCELVTKDYDKYKYWFRVTPYNSNFLVKVDFVLLDMVRKLMAKEFGIEKPKVAIVAEKAAWADPMVKVAEATLPKMGMEVVGVWRPSATAKDVNAELSAIQRAGAQIIFVTFSSSVGIPFSKQAGELQIPAAFVGINVEAEKDGFWNATGGKGDYILILNTYAPVKITDKTIPFFNKYKERFKEGPNYTAGTYDALYILKEAIEKTDTLDPDKLVPVLEKTDHIGTSARIMFSKDHDLVFGPDYATGIGTQWQDGKSVCVWPDGWEGIKYEGTVEYKFAPWVLDHYKKR
ncbi:MAG: ABC transporter substrate-binding protein [Desulfomonilaceae bacterium]